MPRKSVAQEMLYRRSTVVTLNVINVATRVVDGAGGGRAAPPSRVSNRCVRHNTTICPVIDGRV